MLKASVQKKVLEFKLPAGTSRGVLTEKWCWIIKVWEEKNPSIIGLGEASVIKTLSPDWSEKYEEQLHHFANNIQTLELDELKEFPSIRFGFEMALLDLKNGGKQIYFPSSFTEGSEGIKINGLIWMGEKEFMFDQIKQKLALGFDCVKLKIGAIDFKAELDLIQYIRSQFSAQDVELRVDANGAFSVTDALEKLKQLSDFELHSIEQPIKQGQLHEMARLCEQTPLDIALDEELIGVTELDDKKELLNIIQPQYIILKPSLVGGFKASDEWIFIADQNNSKWWITSALESNIGLNAIAQYTATKNNPLPQGLGTGQLFVNNIPSTLNIRKDVLYLK